MSIYKQNTWRLQNIKTKKLEKHHMKSFIGLLLVLVAGANPVQKDFESYHPAPVGHSYSHN
ncbi:hypothetical protein HK103_004433, partial [Boothiomyces macroporosus]